MLTNASMFTWCLNPPHPTFQTGKNKRPSRIIAYRVESVDCLCLSAVSASPSSANVLPCPSFCRLMNSEWVNSRQDQTGRLSMPPKINGETEIESRRDTRWEFPLDFKVKPRCLSFLLEPVPIGLSLICVRLPPNTRLVTSSPAFISHSYNFSLYLPPLLAYLSSIRCCLFSVAVLSPRPTPLSVYLRGFSLANPPRPERSRGQLQSLTRAIGYRGFCFQAV